MWNCRGFRNKKKQLFARNILTDESDIKLYALTETWLTKDIDGKEIELSFKDMKVYRNDRVENKGGGIAVILSEKVVITKQMEVTTKNNMQSLLLRADNPPLDIVLSYYPPTSWSQYNETMEMFEEINSFLNEEPNNPKLMLEDYNSSGYLNFERNEEKEIEANIVHSNEESVNLTFSTKEDM